MVLIVMLTAAGPANGQAGAVVLAADAQGIDCSLSDKTAGMCAFYVVHVGTPGAMACEFSAPVPACFTGTWLSDTVVFPVTVGDSQNGVSIGYGACTPGPIHVLTINFFCQGLTPSCCYYSVKPHPDGKDGVVAAVDCSDNLLTAKGGFGIVNSTAECECGPPTRDSTWGRVKTIFD